MVYDDHNNVGDLGSNFTCNVFDPVQLKPFNDMYKYSFLHLNIRSLSRHHSDLASLFSNSGCHFNVVGCTESWLSNFSYVDLFNLEEYNLHIKNRPNRTGGGVCLYVRSSLQVKICDLDLEDDHSESLFIEINNNVKTLIVGVIYRPPDFPLKTFFHKSDEVLHKLNKLNKDCVLLGDYNIHISKEDGAKQDFMNTLHSSSFFPTVTNFSRVTQTSKTIIDNIITNVQNTKLETGCLTSQTIFLS